MAESACGKVGCSGRRLRYFVRMLYRVAFDSADDTDVDDETTLLEDHPRSLDVIVQTCVKHRIRARIAGDDGQMLGEFVPANERQSSWRH